MNTEPSCTTCPLPFPAALQGGEEHRTGVFLLIGGLAGWAAAAVAALRILWGG